MELRPSSPSTSTMLEYNETIVDISHVVSEIFSSLQRVAIIELPHGRRIRHGAPVPIYASESYGADSIYAIGSYRADNLNAIKSYSTDSINEIESDDTNIPALPSLT